VLNETQAFHLERPADIYMIKPVSVVEQTLLGGEYRKDIIWAQDADISIRSET
jgi:hypothetical protein